MGFFDDVVNTGRRAVSNVTNAVQNPGKALQDIAKNPFDSPLVAPTLQLHDPKGWMRDLGELSRRNLGSLGYMNPFTAVPQIAADYFNQEDKKKAAEAEADAARERLNQSTSLADQVRKRQGLFASQLKENAFKNYGLLSNQAASNEKRALAESLREAKEAAGSRGLVGSGFQKMAQAKAKAGAAANTASKQKQIGDLLQQQIMDAEDLQAQIGLEMGGISQNMADQYYQMAVQNMQNRNNSINSLLGAGARAGGAYLGSRGNNSGYGNFD